MILFDLNREFQEHIAQLAAESSSKKSGNEDKDTAEVDDVRETEEVQPLLRRLLALREQLIAANQRSEKPIDLDGNSTVLSSRF